MAANQARTSAITGAIGGIASGIGGMADAGAFGEKYMPKSLPGSSSNGISDINTSGSLPGSFSNGISNIIEKDTFSDFTIPEFKLKYPS